MSLSIPFKAVLAGLALVLGGGALVLVHLDNNRLQRQLAERSQTASPAAQLNAENTRLRKLLATTTRNDASAAAVVRAQMEQTQNEIAALEKRAAERHAEIAAEAARDAHALATNRDPIAGLVRVETLEHSGQATPTAALKTLAWAALKGDEAAILQVCALPPAARRQAEALIARLPEKTRAPWTPDKLAVLWITGALTQFTAIQIVEEEFSDADHATVTFRTQRPGDSERVKLARDAAGWKIIVPGNAIEKLEKKLGTAAP